MTLPCPFYVVVENCDRFNERHHRWMDRANTVREIAELQFNSGVRQVIEVDIRYNTSYDVTRQIAGEVQDIWASQGDPLIACQQDFIEQHLGVVTANAMGRAA